MNALSEHRFERFVVQPTQRRLLFNGEPVKIGARAFNVLVALIERRPRVVGKSELLDLGWPDVAVEDGNLQVQIFALRKLLGADAIATVPGRGYRFVAGSDGGDPAAVDRTPDLRAGPEMRPGNLPPLLPTLYGRDSAKAELKALISGQRLVTVVGPGGIGKTRLAQAVAHAWRGIDSDGVWLVELAPIEKSEIVFTTTARVLGYALGRREKALASLIASISRQRLLLVLDNCEHVIGAVSELARAILVGAPGVKVLATSQEPLRLPEEQVYRLGSLDVPKIADAATALDHGAVALFTARAHSADARFALNDDNVGAVVEICAQLDGVALAIELAAARIPLLGVHGVRQRLDERLRLLAGGPREALPRHRALSTALEWSYGLLSEDEQYVLDRLGIFVGGFSLTAARVLIADERFDEWMALEHLSTLVDKSLVMVDPGDPPRYRLLETTRVFALGRLAATGAMQASRRKHALAVVAAMRSRGFKKSPLARGLEIAQDIDNLRAATAWAIGPGGDRAIAIELAGEADLIWYVLGANDEGASVFKTIEPWVDDSTPSVAAARFWLSRSKLYSASTRTVAEFAMRAANIFRRMGDRESLFDALTNASLQFSYAGNFDAAETALAEAKTLLDPNWPRWTQIAHEFASSSAKYWAGALKEAQVKLRSALKLSRSDGGDVSHAEQIELFLLGCDVGLRNSHDVVRGANEMLERANPRIRGSIRAVTESFRCAALAQTGDLAMAESLLREALPSITRTLGTARTTLCHVAFIRAKQGRWSDAARLLGAVDGLRPEGSAILAPPNRASYDDATKIACQALGPAEFERLKSEGRILSEDEAVALGFPASGS